MRLREFKDRLRLFFRSYRDRWDRWRSLVYEYWHEWFTTNVVTVGIVAVLITGGMVLLMYIFAVPPSSWAVGTLIIIDVLGLVLVGNVTVDMVKRYEAKNQLVRLLSSLDDERWLYLRDAYLETGYPYFMFYHPGRVPEPDREWFKVWEFLHADSYGTLASQALFQRSPSGRMRYFNEVLEMARRHRRRSQQ